jgi:hypothetical protein
MWQFNFNFNLKLNIEPEFPQPFMDGGAACTNSSRIRELEDFLRRV